jgi:hypothetical protein
MLKQVIEIMDCLDSAKITGFDIKKIFEGRGLTDINVQTIEGEKGSTDFIKIMIPGIKGKTVGKSAPTLGIIGRLGGIGARPEQVGLVSDGDGAVAVLSVALKLIDMINKGDKLDGDLIVSTHICPNAPIKPHSPVAFMGSHVDIQTMNRMEIDSEMDAVLSVDTTKGNKIANWRGFAITPTVKEGWILKVSESLLDIMAIVTGEVPKVCPITNQDITPYGNDLYHINSIMQPATATDKPVVGIAITTQVPVPGCATGASHVLDIEQAARYCLEVAKSFGRGLCTFYDQREWNIIQKTYGSLKILQSK